jgi:TetR/AcrR family transcriptional regulator, ethionamide resistance regulator
MSSQSEHAELYASRAGDRPRGHSGSSDAETAILDAAERLLAGVPLHALSVAQIIQEADISRATFYFYFSSKFAVLTALVARVMDEVYEASRPFVAPGPGTSPEEALTARVRAATAVWSSHRPVLRATVENWHAFPELRALWLSFIERFSRAIAAEIDHERARGNAPPGTDSRQLATVLAWAVERCLYVAGLGVHDFLADETDAADALACIWLGAVYGEPSAGGAAAA